MSPNNGLTTLQVRERHLAGQSNRVDNTTSRPVIEILRSNLFTVFNGILTAAALAVLVFGQWQDTVFILVMVINLLIGVVSELRSKRTLDSLAVLNAKTARALRDGEYVEVLSEDLVIDDVIELNLGDEVPADGVVLASRGLSIDESVLTGESRPVRKSEGDPLLSGTAVLAGSGTMLVQAVGADSWAQKITAEAKVYSLVQSEIQQGVDRILRWITAALPFVIVLLLWSQMRTGAGVNQAVVATVAGVVGMIPQGLVLLTSMNFGITAAKLATKGVLVQELPAVEILARVDVLCLDKTGTITTGAIDGRALVNAPSIAAGDPLYVAARSALHTLTIGGENATASAVSRLVSDAPGIEVDPDDLLPFDSIRKWSALRVDSDSTFIFGAPELLLEAAGEGADWARREVSSHSELGRRTVILAHSEEGIREEELPGDLEAIFVVVLEEEIRPDASQTLDYFYEQGVSLKIISGDSPVTVGTIAREVGLVGRAGELVVRDARTLPPSDSPEFAELALETDVFGRVSPDQKRDLVRVYQKAGHTVAMTGDGVNDALALKTADLGIAMGNAAPATKAVSQLVLVKGEFSVLPGIVGQGRRIMANMERVSGLFLSKTTYAMLIAVIVAVSGIAYPFLPRHLTYIGWFTIGIPAFFLALGPNTRRYRPGFLKRTLLISIPAGLILGAAALISYVAVGEGTIEGSTVATFSVITGGLVLLILLARPWNWWKLTMIGSMALGAALALVIPVTQEFFALAWPQPNEWGTILLAGGGAGAALVAAYVFTAKFRREGQSDEEAFNRGTVSAI